MPSTPDSSPTPPACLVCGNAGGNRILAAREKMNVTMESFDYVQCAACSHLHLAALPANRAPYYAKGYYSFRPRPIPAWHQWPYRARTSATLGGGDFGRLLNHLKPPYYAYWLGKTGLRLGNRVLDVGCGAGNLLRTCKSQGWTARASILICPEIRARPKASNCEKPTCWRNRRSITPFCSTTPRARAQSARGAGKGRDPAGTGRLRCRPHAAGRLVRLFHYGADWIQWDAPRHLNLFTRDSFRCLAEQIGLRVDTTIHDSDKMQFWVSEEYRRNISHNSRESYSHNPRQTLFTKRQLRDYDRWAKWLNEMGAGDQATFICRKAAPA